MGKKRSPVAVLLLSIITLGIYFFVWYYKTNEELKAVSGQPFSSLLWTLMFLLPLIGLISVWKLGAHLEAAERKKGLTPRSGVVTFLLLAIPLVNIVGLPMTQAEINKVWS
jgi:hypothetical protein